MEVAPYVPAISLNLMPHQLYSQTERRHEIMDNLLLCEPLNNMKTKSVSNTPLSFKSSYSSCDVDKDCECCYVSIDSTSIVES